MSDFVLPIGGKPKVEKLIPLSPRPSTLKGKVIALYFNDKIASFPVFKTIKGLLEPLGVKEVFEVHSKAPHMRHPDWAIESALKADVAFVGTADWGSCTAWVTDAAVRIEKGGKPIVLIVAPAFKSEVASHTALAGFPYLPFVVVDYDQEVLPIVPKQTEKAFDKMVKALTTPSEELQKHIPCEVT